MKLGVHSFFHLEILPTALAFYMFGLLSRRLNLIEIVLSKNKKQSQISLLVLMPLLGVLAYINDGVNMAGNYYGNYLLFVVGALIGIYVVSFIAYSIQDISLLSWFGQNSCGFFILHSILVLGVFPWIGEKFLKGIISSYFYSTAWLYFIIAIVVCTPFVFVGNKYIPFAFGKKYIK